MASAEVAATTTPTLQENEKPEANQVEEAVIDQVEAPAATEEAPKTEEVVSEEAKVEKAAPIGEEVVALDAEEAAEEEEASMEVVIEKSEE